MYIYVYMYIRHLHSIRFANPQLYSALFDRAPSERASLLQNDWHPSRSIVLQASLETLVFQNDWNVFLMGKLSEQCNTFKILICF